MEFTFQNSNFFKGTCTVIFWTGVSCCRKNVEGIATNILHGRRHELVNRWSNSNWSVPFQEEFSLFLLDLTICVTRWVCYKKHKLFTLPEPLGSPFFSWCFSHYYSFLCCVFCFVCICTVACVQYCQSLDCPFLIAPLVFTNMYYQHSSTIDWQVGGIILKRSFWCFWKYVLNYLASKYLDSYWRLFQKYKISSLKDKVPISNTYVCHQGKVDVDVRGDCPLNLSHDVLIPCSAVFLSLFLVLDKDLLLLEEPVDVNLKSSMSILN